MSVECLTWWSTVPFFSQTWWQCILFAWLHYHYLTIFTIILPAIHVLSHFCDLIMVIEVGKIKCVKVLWQAIHVTLSLVACHRTFCQDQETGRGTSTSRRGWSLLVSNKERYTAPHVTDGSWASASQCMFADHSFSFVLKFGVALLENGSFKTE